MTIVMPPALQKKLLSSYERLIQMRHDKPRTCCIVASAGLLALALVGHIVSGASIVVVGLLVAAMIFSRYKIEIVNNDQMAETVAAASTSSGSFHDIYNCALLLLNLFFY